MYVTVLDGSKQSSSSTLTKGTVLGSIILAVIKKKKLITVGDYHRTVSVTLLDEPTSTIMVNGIVRVRNNRKLRCKWRGRTAVRHEENTGRT